MTSNAFLAAILPRIETEIAAIVDALDTTPRLKAALRYSIYPGKRIRPVLMLALLDDIKPGAVDSGVRASMALEFIHASSLIHDDLPAMDDDDERRGKPSCHRRFDEATALLTGDLMVGYAFELLCSGAYPAPLAADFVRVLAGAFCDLCYGQELDTGNYGKKDYDLIRAKKTGALFAATAAFAAIAGGLDRAGQEKLAAFGRAFGQIFQLKDDLADQDYGEDRGEFQLALLSSEEALRAALDAAGPAFDTTRAVLGEFSFYLAKTNS